MKYPRCFLLLLISDAETTRIIRKGGGKRPVAGRESIRSSIVDSFCEYSPWATEAHKEEWVRWFDNHPHLLTDIVDDDGKVKDGIDPQSVPSWPGELG